MKTTVLISVGFASDKTVEDKRLALKLFKLERNCELDMVVSCYVEMSLFVQIVVV